MYSKVNRIYNSSKYVCTALALTSFFAACGKKGSGSDLTGTFQISSLKTAGTLNVQAVDFSTVAGSPGHFSFAKIDGVKVTVTKVWGRDTVSDNPKATTDVGDEIELTSDTTKPIALSKEIGWSSGDYAGVDVYLKNEWKVKAYCKVNVTSATDFTLVYSSATGAKTKACTAGAPCTDLPTDYDYTSYSFLDPYYSEHSGDVTIASHYLYSLPSGSTPKVSMYYDSSYNTACWDGASWATNALIGGFSNAASATAGRTHYFPDGTAAFSISTLPLFAYVTTDANEASPTVATYLGSKTSTDLSGTTFDFANVEVVSMLYNSAGSIVAGNARNVHGFNGDSFLDQDLVGFAANGDFYAAGWYYQGGSQAPTFVNNRKFAAFTAPTGASVATVSVSDADGCGKTLKDFQNNNPSRGCFADTGANPRNYYFRVGAR